MNARRLNDILKLAGAVAAVIAAIAPFVPHQYSAPLAAVAAFLAGIGTRGPGLEYKDVAEAKVKASMMPPPQPPAASIAPTETPE